MMVMVYSNIIQHGRFSIVINHFRCFLSFFFASPKKNSFEKRYLIERFCVRKKHTHSRTTKNNNAAWFDALKFYIHLHHSKKKIIFPPHWLDTVTWCCESSDSSLNITDISREFILFNFFFVEIPPMTTTTTTNTNIIMEKSKKNVILFHLVFSFFSLSINTKFIFIISIYFFLSMTIYYST